jgi:hypothetical protein
MSASDNIGTIVTVLRQLTRKTNRLQGALLIERLVRDTGLDAASIKMHLKDLKAQGWIDANAWSGTGAPIGQVRVCLPPLPMATWAQAWDEALHACGRLSETELASLQSCGAQLSDMDSLEFPKILDGLIRLRDNQAALTGMPAFLISARYLLGSSKILQKLGGRALKEFGIDLSRFTDHPAYVITAGASEPSAVVLVENPTAFELAVKTSASKECAFIATFGFGLSKVPDDFGYQLACIVENRLMETVTLVREGSSTPPVHDLLAHPRITFWGDLDIAGMQIYERLARRLPTLSLSALYEPMMAAIATANTRHPYVAAVGKAGQQPYSASRTDALHLLTYCDTWAVDQELLTASDIERLAGKPLAL